MALLEMNCNFYFIESFEEIPAEMKRVNSFFVLTGSKLATKDLCHLKSFLFKNKTIHLSSCSSLQLGDFPLRSLDLAYIIRTSGSTGQKKYVEVTHSSIAQWAEKPAYKPKYHSASPRGIWAYPEEWQLMQFCGISHPVCQKFISAVPR